MLESHGARRISVGVIGYGYWGPHLVRNFSEILETTVSIVCELSPERRAAINARYPGIRTTADWRELLMDPAIDAVAIATPVSTHYDLALAALGAGKHVFVEKPLCETAEHARRLAEEAVARGLVLMVDHTFVYTGAVRKIKDLVTQGRLGDLYYYDSVRVNLGLFQHDVNVLWDLAVHDLAIMDFVLPYRPRAVSALGLSHVAGQPENIAYLTLLYDNSFIGHLHVNWMTPVKVRRTLLAGSREMVVYDDLEPSEKIKVYDRGVEVAESPDAVYQMMISYRTGDMWAPRLDQTEALRLEAQEFARCISTGQKPTTDGFAGLRIVQILEAATVSMAGQGRLVDLLV